MRIELVAVAEDESTREFFAVIQFSDIDGNGRPVELPRSDLDDVRSLRKTLTNAGCYFSRNEDKTETALARLAQSAREAKRWQFAARTGWYHGRRQFVHPQGVIGRDRSGKLVKPPRKADAERVWHIEKRGVHKEWVERVADPARYSSRMVLGICAGLAAPLLGFAGLNSFGILLHGPGKAGKSTLLVVAGSVIGFGSERDLPNFRSTDAALGEIGATFNDMLIPINELGLLKGGPKERSERIRDLSYGFAEGHGTTYSKLAPINKRDAANEWRSIALATGEEANEQISQAAGHTRAIGAAIRWIDLCATRDSQSDIFDLFPKEAVKKDRTTWVREQCVALRKGCRRHHGVAFTHFIRQAIRHRKTIKLEQRELTDQFIKLAAGKDDHPAVRHLLSCFALLATAGCLGVRFGTLPWTERFVIKCIERCYRDARRQLRTESDLLREGLHILKDGIYSTKLLKIGPKKRHSKRAWKIADGYRERTDYGTRATVRGEAFRSWFADQRQPALVLRWLHSKNAISSKHGPSSTATAISWSESQPQWPDGSRPRSIVIKLGGDILTDIEE